MFKAIGSPDQAHRLALDFPTYGVVTAFGLTFVLGSLVWRFDGAPRVSLLLAGTFALCYAPVMLILLVRSNFLVRQ